MDGLTRLGNPSTQENIGSQELYAAGYITLEMTTSGINTEYFIGVLEEDA